MKATRMVIRQGTMRRGLWGTVAFILRESLDWRHHARNLESLARMMSHAENYYPPSLQPCQPPSAQNLAHSEE